MDKLATGRCAGDIVKALGLEDKHVTKLSIHFEYEALVTMKIECNLTEEQVKALGGEVGKITKTYHLIETETEDKAAA